MKTLERTATSPPSDEDFELPFAGLRQRLARVVETALANAFDAATLGPRLDASTEVETRVREAWNSALASIEAGASDEIKIALEAATHARASDLSRDPFAIDAHNRVLEEAMALGEPLSVDGKDAALSAAITPGARERFAKIDELVRRGAMETRKSRHRRKANDEIRKIPGRLVAAGERHAAGIVGSDVANVVRGWAENLARSRLAFEELPKANRSAPGASRVGRGRTSQETIYSLAIHPSTVLQLFAKRRPDLFASDGRPRPSLFSAFGSTLVSTDPLALDRGPESGIPAFLSFLRTSLHEALRGLGLADVFAITGEPMPGRKWWAVAAPRIRIGAGIGPVESRYIAEVPVGLDEQRRAEIAIDETVELRESTDPMRIRLLTLGIGYILPAVVSADMPLTEQTHRRLVRAAGTPALQRAMDERLRDLLGIVRPQNLSSPRGPDDPSQRNRGAEAGDRNLPEPRMTTTQGRVNDGKSQ